MKTPISLLFFLLSTFIVVGQDADTFLVKPYLQFATQSSIKVLWETPQPTTAKVYYGKARLRAEKPVFDSIIRVDEAKKLQEVLIPNLDTAQKYIYQVEAIFPNGKSVMGGISTFKTNVRKNDAMYFALVGDSQYSGSSPGKWGDIAKMVWEERPNFIIHAGDLVDVGTRKTDWTDYFLPLGHEAMRRFPMYTVLGNHEQDADHYYNYMANPEPEYYYTFKYGNAQFFMIDTNKDVSEGSEQYDWLEWALSRSDATWKFVVHHHPPYSSEENDHGDTYIGASVQGTHARNLVPLYEAYGVDFCLYGHTHVYERSWPLNDNKINKSNGVIYINSGGAGGGLEDFDPVRSWFTKELENKHHYCTFAIHGEELSFRAINDDGKLFDYFTMNKMQGRKSAFNIPPAPHFELNEQVFQKKTRVAMEAVDSDHEIRYTLDGSDPNAASALYVGPFEIAQTATLKARCFNQKGNASRMVKREFRKMKPQKATKKATKSGLFYKYYEGSWDSLPNFEELEVIKSGLVNMAGIAEVDHRENHFGVVLEGYLRVPETQTYTLFTYSDDGSKLYLNEELLIDSDGNHSARYVYGTTILEKGLHKIRIEYFEGGGGNYLSAGFAKGNGEKVPFTPFELSH